MGLRLVITLYALTASRERKKLKEHGKQGQCDNVTEMFVACSYAMDGDYMFGVTVGPIARVLKALKVPLFLLVGPRRAI